MGNKQHSPPHKICPNTKLSSFFQLFLDWVDLFGLARDVPAQNEFASLLNVYKNDPDKWNKVYTYDTYNKGWFYLDGEKRKPFQKR